MSHDTIAIIVAGGAGKRFGSETPKQFLELNGKPLLWWTLRAFEQADSIDAICAVVPDGHQQSVSDWEGLSKLQWVIAGGRERQDSMIRGFESIPPCELVLVHDGARPLVSEELIDEVVAGTRGKGGVVPGLAVAETLKKVSEKGHILATVDRSDYATIQTPQGFRYTILAEAIQEACTDGFCGTDEAMLIERMGFPVCMVSGSSENIKVTTPEDMKLAETILSRQKGAA